MWELEALEKDPAEGTDFSPQEVNLCSVVHWPEKAAGSPSWGRVASYAARGAMGRAQAPGSIPRLASQCLTPGGWVMSRSLLHTGPSACVLVATV